MPRSRRYLSRSAYLPPTERVSVTVTASGLASGGSAICTIVGEDPPVLDPPAEPQSVSKARPSIIGKKIFVPLMVPGEEGVVQVVKDSKSFAEGHLVSLSRRSPHRIAPPCPHFGECGGCDLQHIELSHQRELKRLMIENDLRVQGGVLPTYGVSLLGPALTGFAYRRRMSFHMNREGEFGLYKKHGRRIQPLTRCPISTEVINSCLKECLSLFKQCAPEAETVTIEDHDGEVYVALEVHPRSKDAADALVKKEALRSLCAKVASVQVNYRHRAVFRSTDAGATAADAPPVGHFSQNNQAATEEMIQEILRLVRTETVTDLYAGAGNISLPLAAAGKVVHAVELDPHLVEFGKLKASRAGLTGRLSFVTMSCEKWIESGEPDPTVVLDPPRSGAFEVVKRLLPTVSPSVVYVSCYPPTFVRDTVELLRRGYELLSVKVLDMFPQTYHCELVAEFKNA
jgi:23S rRNA (uracil1939-C5)-methyltransferase